jgi:hypothetical protein
MLTLTISYHIHIKGLYGNSDNFASYSITQASCLYSRPLCFRDENSLCDGWRGSRMNFKPTQLHQKPFIWQLWQFRFIFYYLGSCLRPRPYFFLDENSLCDGWRGSRMNFKPTQLHQNPFIWQLWQFRIIFYYSGQLFIPQTIIFRNDKLTVRWTARIQNEF